MNKEKGLTLIELLTTISILVAVVTVMLALGNRAVGQAGYLAAQTEGVFLAKEGVELVRQMEATIRSEAEGVEVWQGGVDYLGNTSTNCQLFKNSEGFYGHVTGEETPFSRCVYAWAKEGEASPLEVKVEVSFPYHGNDHSVNLYRVFYE